MLAVSCACTPLVFNGLWSYAVVPSPPPSSASFCFDTQCDEVESGVLTAQSLLCYGSPTVLYTYQANLTVELIEKVCVNVSVFAVSGHVFSQAPQSPLALSFLQTNYNLMENNPYAVVTNGDGIIVGQIHSALIRVVVQMTTLNQDFHVILSPCLLIDPTMNVTDNGYPVSDVGQLYDDGSIHPMNLTVTGVINLGGNEKMICFGDLLITQQELSFILIERVEN